LWVIGITGGVDEERLGTPLVGPSGWTTDTALQLKRYPKLKVGRWNVLNCRATKMGSPLQGPHVINRTQPTVREMRDCCRRWLFPELAKTRAKVILILGTDAYKFLMAHRFDVFGKAMGHRLRLIQDDIVLESKKVTEIGLPWEVLKK
jgi:uracil-DNA glycosylase family 4